MSDGSSEAYRDQCRAEELSLKKWGHLSDAELDAKWRELHEQANTLRDQIKPMAAQLKALEQDLDELSTAAYAKRNTH